MKKGFKRFLTVAMAATLVFGTTMSAFAEGEGTSEGAGTYEGGEMKYPTLSVTLPTIPAGTYDYIADPNGLIALTSAAAHTGFTFTGDTGIFFKTTDSTYTDKSAVQTLTNQNAQDIDVTVKLEQKTAGSDFIEYASTATFEETDTANKLYLAITDGAQSDPEISALSSSAAATLTTTVAGKKDNYEPSWSQGGGYIYKLKTGDLTWNSCSYNMIGALNLNAEWGDTVTFPAIKVTWSYAAHQEAPATYTVTYNANYEGADPATATEDVEVGSNPTGPETAFSREGYTQSGWATTADGEAVALTTITEATTLYALWTQDSVDPAISDVTSFNKANASDVVITFTYGAGAAAIEADSAVLYQGAGDTAVNTAKYSVNMTAGTITIDKSAGFLTGASADVPIKVVLKNGDEIVATLTGTIEIE